MILNLDARLQSFFSIFVTSAITEISIANGVPGQRVTLLFIQDGTGHSVSAGGGNLQNVTPISSSANATTVQDFTFNALGDTWINPTTTASASPVTPGGTDTAVQFNNAGAFGGDSDAFSWDDAAGSFEIFTENDTSQIMFGIGPTQSMSFDMDATQTPPDMSFVNLETGGTMEITSDGLMTISSPTTGVLIGASSLSPIAFYGGTPEVKQAVTGSKGGNAALTSLVEVLATLGLITNSTT